MTPETYWKLSAQIARLAKREAELTQEHQQLQAARTAALTEAGLDPAKTYTLADADCSATEQPAPAPVP